MGSPKALLAAPDGRPFVVRVAHTLIEGGADDVVIVTGPAHDAIVDALGTHELVARVRVVPNPDPDRGQLSSLLTGMASVVNERTEGLIVTLVDVPLVEAGTVRAVVDAWKARRAWIVRPAIGSRHGHPVIFDRHLFGALREAPPELGAKSVVRAHAAAIENVTTTDHGCLVDVDTPEDFRGLRLAGRR
jgi:molybdenum cofactor cytidylyltransferase